MNSDQGIETNNSDSDYHQTIYQWFNNRAIRIIGSHEEPFFYAVDIAKAIGIKKVEISMRNFTKEDIVSPEQREKYGIITYRKYKDTVRKDQTVLLLTLRGAYRLIAQSRTSVAEELRRRICYELDFYRIVPEANFINKIKTIFSTEVFEVQKHVLNYYVDLYMPDYNLAIEFDERHHMYQQEDDALREKQIVDELKCTFIRVKITDDIFAAASKIYAFIHAY